MGGYYRLATACAEPQYGCLWPVRRVLLETIERGLLVGKERKERHHDLSNSAKCSAAASRICCSSLLKAIKQTDMNTFAANLYSVP